MEFIPLPQGKRVQTAICQSISVPKPASITVREHQSWTTPHGQLRNLYQRQCLTVDRDAPSGLFEEIWTVPLSGGAVAVLFVNRGPKEAIMQASYSTMGLKSDVVYTVHDLWQHEDLPSIPTKKSLSVTVKSHDVTFLKFAPK